MQSRQHSEVLVVGAGPVGMLTALLLAQTDVDVVVIDQAAGVAGQSYACGLHPGTLQLLQSVGLADELFSLGRKIDKISFYEEKMRRAQLELSQLPVEFPFVLVLPQTSLETALERKLKSTPNVRLLWNHRLAGLRSENGTMSATINELAGTVTGYDVPRWEVMAKRTSDWTARFVVGADGFHSFVRRIAGINCAVTSRPEVFVVYEFESDLPDNEIQVVLNKTNTNVMWPLPGQRCRWGFQWTESNDDGEGFPLKERHAMWSEDRPIAQRTRQHLESLLETRAPWFAGTIGDVDWAADVQFEHRLAEHYGQSRCWLAGDAAHQTGPVGMQSMNVGLREAEQLAAELSKVLREHASLDGLDSYEQRFRWEWQRLLGTTAGVQPIAGRPVSVQNRASLLSCLPGSGEDLEAMLDMLGMRLTPPRSALAMAGHVEA